MRPLAYCLSAGLWRTSRHLWGGVALVVLIAAGLALILNPLWRFASAAPPTRRHAGPVLLDRLALLVRAVAIAGGIVLVLSCWDAMPENRAADYHACLLLMVAGMGLSGAANELVTLFLALELTSIPTYLILYIGKSRQPGGGLDAASQEAAMKYFLLSVFSSALTLFGFSYLYGLAGTTNLPGLADAFRRSRELTEPSPLMGMGMIALVMVVAGLGFRLTAVPFHFYAPDVYQGTTTANAAVLAFVPKVAGFAALVRVLGFVVPTLSHEVFTSTLNEPILSEQLPVLLWIMAAVTMSLGNVLGLLQDNLRRLLAYSSVAHAGYMLIGLAAAPGLIKVSDAMVDGVDAMFFYLVSYAAMTLWCLRRSSISERERPACGDDGRFGRAEPHAAGHSFSHGVVSIQPHWHSVDGGIHGQISDFRRSARYSFCRGTEHLAKPADAVHRFGRFGGDQRGDWRLVLFADRRRDVSAPTVSVYRRCRRQRGTAVVRAGGGVVVRIADSGYRRVSGAAQASRA